MYYKYSFKYIFNIENETYQKHNQFINSCNDSHYQHNKKLSLPILQRALLVICLEMHNLQNLLHCSTIDNEQRCRYTHSISVHQYRIDETFKLDVADNC